MILFWTFLRRFSGRLMLALLPLLSMLFLLNQGHLTLPALMPTWSDEIFYWHQSATFQQVGLAGGYYTVNEAPAPVEQTHYNAWGVFVPAFYGTLGKLTGWSLASIPALTQALVWVALLGLLLHPQVTNRAAVGITLVVLTFIPLLLFAPSSMLEVAQYALALGLATLTLYLLGQAPLSNVQRLRRALLVVGVLSLCAPLRLTWALLCIPLLALAIQPRRWWQWVSIVVVGIAVLGGMIILIDRVSAPDVKFVQTLRTTLQADIGAGLRLWLDKIQENILLLWQGHPLEILQRVQYLVLIMALCLWGMVYLVRRLRQRTEQALVDNPLTWEIGFHLYNLGSILAFQVLLYDVFDWRDYRVLAPHLLLSLVVFAARRRWLLAGLGIASMAVFLPLTMTTYQSADWYGNYALPESHASYATWQATLAPILVYDADAPSAWCNTVLHTFIYFNEAPLLLAIEPGLGISTILNDETLPFPLKSQYVLLHDDFVRRYGERMTLEALLDVPHGKLYRNLDAGCTE